MGLFMIPILPLAWLMRLVGLEPQAGALAGWFMELVMAAARLLRWGV